MATQEKKTGKLFDQQEEEDDGKSKAKERGTKDDWESLKVVLESLPALKQRVLHKLRALRDKDPDAERQKISRQAQADYRREQKKARK